eukprot:989681-Prymnesium_polylepis.1
MSLTLARAALVGLDGAGKSSIVLSIQGRQLEEGATQPTKGCNKSCLYRIDGGKWVVQKDSSDTNWFSLELLDLGGSDAMRPYWPHVCSGVNALIAVVDATETDEARWAALALDLERLRAGMGAEGDMPLPVLALLNRKGAPMTACAAPRTDLARLGLADELG